MDHITLNNGITIPQVGLGTYLLEPMMPSQRSPTHSTTTTR